MPCSSIYDLPQLYDSLIGRGPCEAFYTALARRTGGPVLELACGTGRLTVPLAASAIGVVGLDASRQMLEVAGVKAAEAGVEIKFVRGDMRTFALNRLFPLIILSCNSLAHLDLSMDLRACLAAVRAHLAPGGLFAFDVMNPNVQQLAAARGEVIARDLGLSGDDQVEEVASYDPIQQVRVAQWRVCEDAGRIQHLAPLRLRQFFPQELPLLLENAGLELVCRYGDFDCGPLTSDSLNQICLAHSHVEVPETRDGLRSVPDPANLPMES
jgi:SAM-dependent methyltransferase